MNWEYERKSEWTKMSLSVPGTILEHWFFRIWLFKNLQIFQYDWKTDYVEQKGKKIETIKFLLKKEFYLKYIVIGDEIRNKWSSDISPTTKHKLQKLQWNIIVREL